QVIVMRHGEIREQGTAEQVLEQPKDVYTRALLYCRPQMSQRPYRLPITSDFMRQENNILVEQSFDVSEIPERKRGLNGDEQIILEVKDLKKSFYSRKGLFGKEEFQAVKGVSFKLAKGKTLGLVGESGSGKTTVGLLLMRLHQASGGQALIEGKDMDDADNLIPNYLRFVQGVVDSADLPLNVSRELLQESRDVKTIREGNARRVLTLLDGLAKSEDEKDQEKFKTFYTEFGSVLKEGLGEDFGNRERILKLLRYATSTNDEVTTSFADYKARMKEGQKAIYYVTAESLAAAKNSPQLELFKKKGIEVLLMAERVDEWAMNFVHEFDGTPLKNVSKGAVDLGDLQDAEEKKALEQAAEQFKPVVEKLSDSLKAKTKEVRVTTRLVDSPACLVTSEGELSPQLIRMLKQA
ncbi:ATP-binding cassette domain-containing protein, partial [Acinetobacter baumannii]